MRGSSFYNDASDSTCTIDFLYVNDDIPAHGALPRFLYPPPLLPVSIQDCPSHEPPSTARVDLVQISNLVRALQKQCDIQRAQLLVHEAQLADNGAQLADNGAQLADHDARLADLDAQLADNDARITKLEAGFRQLEVMNEDVPQRSERVLREGSMESYRWRKPDIEVTALQQGNGLSQQCQDMASCISASVVEQLEEQHLEATFQLEERYQGFEADAAAFRFGIDRIKVKTEDMNRVLIFQVCRVLTTSIYRPSHVGFRAFLSHRTSKLVRGLQ